MKSSRIGCVKYLNARPLIHGWPGPVTFDHPVALCAQLANGDLDVALVSSFEFLRNPIYRIVDDVSISSAGPVHSVVVAYHGDISEVEEIGLDPASATSVNLLRCLLADLNLNPRLLVHCEMPNSETRARLLIGDQAIRFRKKHGAQFRFWDLGEQWNNLVRLPFVYALWLIRPEVRDCKLLAKRLRKLRDENLADLEKVIESVVAGGGDPGHGGPVDPEFCRRYYKDCLRFSFGENEKAGLREFHKRCSELRLLPQERLDPGDWGLELPLRCV